MGRSTATLIWFLSILTGATPASGDAFGERVRAYILENPEVILEAMEVLAAREAAAETARMIADHAPVLFDLSHVEYVGDPNAPHLIVELFDYKCQVCKAGHPTLEEFVAKNPDVVIAVQQLPVLGPQSDRAARAYLALHRLHGAQAASGLHRELFAFSGAISSAALSAKLRGLGFEPTAIESAMHGAEVSRRIDAIKDAALGIGAIGTPVFITENAVHQGVATADVLTRLVAGLQADDEVAAD